MSRAEELPLEVDGLTADWLSGALAERSPGIEVNEVEIVETFWGTATEVRLRVRHAEHPGADGPPAGLCVKGGFEERMRRFGSLTHGDAPHRQLLAFWGPKR